jgi:hypothetical protein
MAEQLAQMAGPGAVLRVNGFSGGRLPPKSQIAEIRFRFDPYSAENHEAGFPRVDIRTRPGNGTWRNNASVTFRDESLNARNAFAPDKPSEQARRYQYSMDGPIKKGKTSFSFSVGGMDAFDTETIRTRNADGTVFSGVASPSTDRINFNARVEHAINRNQMLRVEYSRNATDQSQLGVGSFDLFERAYDREVRGHEFRISTSGPVFRRMRNEVRFEVDWDDSTSRSLSDAVTLRVQDAFTSGGAQVSGGRRSRAIEFADNLDFAIGKKHAMRAGVLVEGGSYRSDDFRNYNGTFTFASADAFAAGQALQFSQRVGDPLVEYNSFQFGAYIQDDFRVQKNLLVSAGLRYEAQTHLGDNVNLSPRLSFAWTPFKSGTTTIRGGFGVFNEWYGDSLYEQALRLDGVRQYDLIVRNPSYPAVDVNSGTRLPASVTRVSSDLVMPRITRASFGVEHALASWAQLRSNYFIQRTSDEFRAVNLNAAVNGVVPFPDLGIITYVDAIGEAKSQGVDLSMNLNYAPKRIFGAINYRLAKAMNDGDSATSLPVNGGDLAAEWGPSRGDVRHRIFGFVTVPLVYGFRTNLNMRYESGQPYNVTTGFDDNGDGIINDRPIDVGRNSARGDGQLNVDLRLGWQKSLGQPRGGDQGPGGGPVVVRAPGGGGRGPGGGGRGGRGGFGGGLGPGGPGQGRVNFEIFAQVSNLTNTVNYRNYSGVLTSDFFGQPTASAEPRRVELGMRVGF